MYEKSWHLKFYVQQLASLILTNNYILTRWFLSPPLGELCALGGLQRVYFRSYAALFLLLCV